MDRFLSCNARGHCFPAGGTYRPGDPCPVCRSPLHCSQCGGATTCACDAVYAASPLDLGLPADWEPPLRYSMGNKGYRSLDWDHLPAIPGWEWIVVGKNQSLRIGAAGGRTWWCGMCSYLAAVKVA